MWPDGSCHPALVLPAPSVDLAAISEVVTTSVVDDQSNLIGVTSDVTSQNQPQTDDPARNNFWLGFFFGIIYGSAIAFLIDLVPRKEKSK